MKFQTIILSTLLIATSSASLVSPQRPNGLPQSNGIKNVASGIKDRVKVSLGNIGRKPSYQSPPFNPKGGLSRRPGVISTPPTARTQVIKTRGFLKTAWNVGKGLLGL